VRQEKVFFPFFSVVSSPEEKSGRKKRLLVTERNNQPFPSFFFRSPSPSEKDSLLRFQGMEWSLRARKRPLPPLGGIRGKIFNRK